MRRKWGLGLEVQKREQKEKHMFCTTCGSEINDRAVVCPHCGVSITGRRQAPSPAPAPSPSPAPAYNRVYVPNYMVGAILTTFLCCLPGGIVAIIFSSQVNTKLAQGDIAGARSSASAAKGWIIFNICFGLLIPVLYFLLVMFFGVPVQNV